MRFAIALGSVVLAVTTGVVAPALATPPPPLSHTQVSNGATQACVDALQPSAGIFTLDTYELSGSVAQNPDGTSQAQFQFELDLSYNPNDPTLPSYSGTQVL